jgi:hypothetical protein
MKRMPLNMIAGALGVSRNIFCAVVLLAVPTICDQSFAQSSSPAQQAKHFGDEMMQTYFRHPNAGMMVDELVTLPPSNPPRLDWPYILGAFFSQVVNADPMIGDLLVKKGTAASPEVKSGIVLALDFSHGPERVDLIRGFAGNDGLKKLVPSDWDIRTFKITYPTHLDMMWACFFATGDGFFVGRIAETLDGWVPDDRLPDLQASAKNNPSLRPQFLKAVIAKTAIWSLISNAKNMPEVRVALAKFAAGAHGVPATMAAIIVGKTQQDGSQQHDGRQ